MTATVPDAQASGDTALQGVFRIDREGAWHHEDVEVTHPGVLRNLYANLRADGETHYLQVGPRRVTVQVDGAPFVVVRVEPGSEPETIDVHLTDGSREPLDAETLELDRREVPYCRVKERRFRARLSVPAWLQLAANVEVEPASGESVLILGDRRFVFRRRE
jgi:hypothetical protein